ncbi:Nramp family divalent metal transporter [Aureibaculum luteum]|uniref:Nramp family divalent metal transporter n=1 Tax=Aureibaculum luteum TaxID=1548456 RepID=UPI000E4A1DA8|nr:Nramp family divalent metal transporter [Aureibaculum luteum]
MNKSWLKKLGPGLLFAGAAIGVSHLVQSTRAGADFGFGLIWAILLVNLFKYPFFQYGPRYATATGESLIDGYKRLGKGVLIVYYILTFTTMFTIQAAVTIVTAGLAANLFGITPDVTIWSIIITLICLTTLLIGKYKLLDNLIKVIIVILTVSTLIAVGVAIFKTNKTVSFTQIIPKGALEIGFLITFLGWMPAPLDISTWHSLWALEKQKDGDNKYNTKQSIFDFNIGYVGTTILAFCFLGLGALIMYQSGNEFSSSAGVFAQQIIGLYTETLGSQTAIFIGVAAFTTMLSTTLTTLDASPRAMERSSVLLFQKKTKLTYNFWIIILSAGTMIILFYFISNMIALVKVATILSFLTAPFYAIANFMLISSRHTPKEWRPSMGMKIVSYLGILFLVGFSVWYLFNL